MNTLANISNNTDNHAPNNQPATFTKMRPFFNIWEKLFLVLWGLLLALILFNLLFINFDLKTLVFFFETFAFLLGFYVYKALKPKLGTGGSIFLGFYFGFALGCLLSLFFPEKSIYEFGDIFLFFPFLVVFLVYKWMKPKFGLWKSILASLFVMFFIVPIVSPLIPKSTNSDGQKSVAPIDDVAQKYQKLKEEFNKSLNYSVSENKPEPSLSQTKIPAQAPEQKAATKIMQPQPVETAAQPQRAKPAPQSKAETTPIQSKPIEKKAAQLKSGIPALPAQCSEAIHSSKPAKPANVQSPSPAPNEPKNQLSSQQKMLTYYILTGALSNWSPFDIKEQGDIIVITLEKEDILTKQLYEEVLHEGICSPYKVTVDKKYLEGVREIRVANNAHTQVGVVTNPRAYCKKNVYEPHEARRAILREKSKKK